jgi:Protein of unknown function (DUF1203)
MIAKGMSGFDANNMMIDADVINGRDAEQLINRLFQNPQAAYLNVNLPSAVVLRGR